MAAFHWKDQVECPAPGMVCTPLDTRTNVKSLRATDAEQGCQVDLVAVENPSVAVILSDTEAEGRSGSAASPIPLDKLQQYSGNQIPMLAFINAAGQLAAWNPPVACDGRRITVESGDFVIRPDINSNVFDESCIGNFADVEYIAGGQRYTDCNGVQRMKLVFFPKAQLPVPPPPTTP